MYQKLTIIGNLGRAPEMRYTPSGQAVTNLSVATTRKWTSNSGEKKEQTTWFRVAVWGKQAETCQQYLAKGRQVLVEGNLVVDEETGGPRVWVDQNGKARASFEINAHEVKFLGSANGQRNQDDGGDPDEAPVQDLDEEEIPF